MLLGIRPRSSVTFNIIVPSVKVSFDVPGNLGNQTDAIQKNLTQFHIRVDDLKLAWSTCTVLVPGFCLVHV